MLAMSRATVRSLTCTTSVHPANASKTSTVVTLLVQMRPGGSGRLRDLPQVSGRGRGENRAHTQRLSPGVSGPTDEANVVSVRQQGLPDQPVSGAGECVPETVGLWCMHFISHPGPREFKWPAKSKLVTLAQAVPGVKHCLPWLSNRWEWKHGPRWFTNFLAVL